MVNLKVGGIGIIVTFVVSFIEVIFIPMINTNLTTLKASAPSAAENTTLLNTQKILFVLPLFTVLGGLLASVVAAFVVGKRM